MELLVAIVVIFIVYKLIQRILKIPRISHIDSRYILVTGCDTGFGNAIAKRLDALGCHVIATCLTESGETELRKSCSQKLHTIYMDVSNSESVKKSYEEVTNMLPSGKGLWGLLNNAGIFGRNGPLSWLTLDDYRKVTSVNLFGLIDVTMTFLPLIKKERGRIVNMASVAGRVACQPCPYSLSKYGVENFSDNLRREMKDFKVSVSIVEPELFKTPLVSKDINQEALRRTFETQPAAIKEEYGQEYLKKTCAIWETLVGRHINEDITPVVDAYTHGLLGKYPRARYLVGKTSWLYGFVQSLPEWLGDRILRFNMVPPKAAVSTLCTNLPSE